MLASRKKERKKERKNFFKPLKINAVANFPDKNKILTREFSCSTVHFLIKALAYFCTMFSECKKR